MPYAGTRLTPEQWTNLLQWMRLLSEFESDTAAVSYGRRWAPYRYLTDIVPENKCKLYRKVRKMLLYATEQE